jgi:hypothetical protein
MDYKILFVPQIGVNVQFEKEYETQEEAETALTAISLYTLGLHEWGFMPDHSSCGMVLTRDSDGDWVEIDGNGERTSTTIVRG